MCRASIRILVHPAARSEYPQRSVAVWSSTTLSLKWYTLIMTICLGLRNHHTCLQYLCADIPDLSDNHGRFLHPPSEGYAIDNNVRHVANTQIDFAIGIKGTKFQSVQEEIVDQLEAQGAPGSSDPPGLSRTTIVDVSLPSGDLSSQSLAHNNYPSSPHGHAEGAAHTGPNVATQTSQRREQKKRRMK